MSFTIDFPVFFLIISYPGKVKARYDELMLNSVCAQLYASLWERKTEIVGNRERDKCRTSTSLFIGGLHCWVTPHRCGYLLGNIILECVAFVSVVFV